MDVKANQALTDNARHFLQNQFWVHFSILKKGKGKTKSIFSYPINIISQSVVHILPASKSESPGGICLKSQFLTFLSNESESLLGVCVFLKSLFLKNTLGDSDVTLSQLL